MNNAPVRVEHDGPITIVTIDRPDARNAVDRPTAHLLADAFRAFDADGERSVAILTGANGVFCAGADLKAVGDGRGNAVTDDGDGPMGPTRMLLTKPVIAAVEGYSVGSGLSVMGSNTRCWARKNNKREHWPASRQRASRELPMLK